MVKETRKFFDVKNKRSFRTNNYDIIKKDNKKGRIITMAKAKAPSGIMAFVIISNNPKKKKRK